MSSAPAPFYMSAPASGGGSAAIVLVLVLVIVLGLGGYFYYRYYQIQQNCGDTKDYKTIFNFTAIPESVCTEEDTATSPPPPTGVTLLSASDLFNGSHKNDIEYEQLFMKTNIEASNVDQLIDYFNLYQGSALQGYTVANVAQSTTNVSCGATALTTPVNGSERGVLGFNGCERMCSATEGCVGFEMAYDLTNIVGDELKTEMNGKDIHIGTCFLKTGDFKETASTDKRNCYIKTPAWKKKYNVPEAGTVDQPKPPAPPSGDITAEEKCYNGTGRMGNYFYDGATQKCNPVTKTCPTAGPGEVPYKLVQSTSPTYIDNKCIKESVSRDPTCGGGLTFNKLDFTLDRSRVGGACYNMDCSSTQSKMETPFNIAGLPPICGDCGGSQFPLLISNGEKICGHPTDFSAKIFGSKGPFDTNDSRWSGQDIYQTAFDIDSQPTTYPTNSATNISLPPYLMAGANIWVACDDTNGRMFASQGVDSFARIYPDFKNKLTTSDNTPFPATLAEFNNLPSIKNLKTRYGDASINIHVFMGAYDKNYKQQFYKTSTIGDTSVDLTTSGKYIFRWDQRVYEAGFTNPSRAEVEAATGDQRRYYLMKYGGVYVLNDGSIFPLGKEPVIVYKRPLKTASPKYGCYALPELLTVTWTPIMSNRTVTDPVCDPGAPFNPVTSKCESKPVCDKVRDTTTANGSCIYKPSYS